MLLSRFHAATEGRLSGGGRDGLPISDLPRARQVHDSTGRWRFWLIAYSLVILNTGSNLSTPLYRDYQARFGFSPLVVTLIFAAYVAVLIPSLLILGPLSDVIGRRRLLLPALGVAAAGSLVFAFASQTWWLFAGRVLQGLALGAAVGPMTAVLTELEPSGNRRKATLVSTVASMGGLGLGPLLAGALAQYAPAPAVLPYMAHIVLLAPVAAAVAILPAGRRPSIRWRPRRPQIPEAARSVLASSGTSSFLAFTVVGLFLTFIPAYITTLSGSANLLIGGAAVGLFVIFSVLAQFAGYGKPVRNLQLTGLPLLAVGLALIAVAGQVSSLFVLVVATALVGGGHGLTFLSGLTAFNEAAPARHHAEVVSSFWVINYLGIGLPVIGVGFFATVIGLLPAVRYFAGLVATVCLVLPVILMRRGKYTAAQIDVEDG
ncbi:MFS transporter [Pseudonocardia xinjiangensis]|uniref:MFS transporter n=1 Tax=Pseudonocardia xinjiangensis TaxID=75289 RepID=UPI003D90F308